MAGETDVTIVGRTAKLIEGPHIVLRCTDVRTALSIMLTS